MRANGTELLEKKEKLELQHLYLSKCIFDVREQPLEFLAYDTVVLEDCVFEGGAGLPILFHSCESVRMESCVFRNFSSRVMEVENIRNGIELKDCIFQNCLYPVEPEESVHDLGTVLYSAQPERIGEVLFFSCLFQRCGSVQKAYNTYAQGMLSNCNGLVFHCTFDGCGLYSGGGELDLYEKQNHIHQLFSESTSLECCKETDGGLFLTV